MTLNIVSLPEEIIFKIFTPLERRELCALRLVCHRLHSAATQTLFSLVRLYPTDESIARFNQIIQHPSFKTYVRHVELNTLEAEDVPPPTNPPPPPNTNAHRRTAKKQTKNQSPPPPPSSPPSSPSPLSPP